MKFIAEPAEPIPPIAFEPPAVDYGDEFLMRREVRVPSRRDLVHRRPPLPRWFRRPGPPDLSDGERGLWIPASDELQGGTYITVAEGVINCTLVGGDNIEIADNAINCTLLGRTHITIDGGFIDHDGPGEKDTQIAESGVWSVANAWVDVLGHVIL